MGKFRVVQIQSGANLFGSVLLLHTAEGILKMQSIPEDEAMFIHLKNCRNCREETMKNFGERMISLLLVEKLGFQDPIKEILVRVGRQDEKRIFYTADVKTISGKKYGAVPSCAIALAMTQKVPYAVYVDEELLAVQKEITKRQVKQIKEHVAKFAAEGFPG